MKKIIQLLILFLMVSFLTEMPSQSADTKDKANNVQKKKINVRAFELCQLAVKVASEGDYNAAVVYLQKALEIDSKFPDALFNLGSIYRIQKKYQDSYATFQQLLMINSQDHEARLEKVLTLIGMKSYKDAANELKKVPSTEKRYPTIKAQLDKVYKVTEVANNSNNADIAHSLKTTPKLLEEKSGLYAANKPVLSRNKTITANQRKSLPFTSPTGITADGDNNIYVANFTTNTIEKISADGTKREIFATGEQIAGPSGIIYDEYRKQLLVSNYKAGTVVSIDQVGRIKVLLESLEKPYSLFLQKDGRLYVSEQGKKTLSIISIH